MNDADAKKLVIVSTGGIVLISSLSYLHGDPSRGIPPKTWPPPTVPAGAFIAGSMMALVAEVWPQVAGALMATALVSTLFLYGGGALDLITRYVSGGRTSAQLIPK